MNRKSNRLTLAVLGVGAVMLAGSGIALAAPQATPQAAEVVRYGDLNLATPAGIHKLANRIQTAAWQVCRDVISPSSTGPSHIANTQCQEIAVKEAVDKVNNPTLSKMFPVAPSDDDLTSD